MREPSKEDLENIYKSIFLSDNGNIIIKDLENIILKSIPFSEATTGISGISYEEDVKLREGARFLLNYIYYQTGKIENSNEWYNTK